MAFHPYPQLIRGLLKVHRFGPPPGFTRASSWPRVDHLRFGSSPGDWLVAGFGLAFAAPPGPPALRLAAGANSQTHYAKGTPSPRQAGAPTPWGRMISGALSLRSRRCFSPFPRGTGSLSVARRYLALGGGPPGFARRSTCAALLRIPLGASPAFGHGALTLCGAAFQPPGLAAAAPRRGPINPPAQAPGFGLFRFRSPLPAESQFAFCSSAY